MTRRTNLLSERLFFWYGCRWRLVPAIALWLTCVVSLVPLSSLANTQEPAGSNESPKQESELPTTNSVALPAIVDEFTPGITDHDLDASVERAWEFRPYRVAVWFCLDGSPELNAIYPKLVDDVTRRSELIDPSGWDLAVGKAPSQWRWKFLELVDNPEKCVGFERLPMLATYDKLMVVCLKCRNGETNLRVREFDMQTQQWGPLLDFDTGHMHQLGASIMNSLKVAFMPLARVDRVIEKNSKDEVFIQARAVDACFRTELNAELKWVTVPIEGSPVYIKNEDRLLPVIRRTDRQGNLVKLEPIEFTFLTIDENNGSQLTCSIQSAYRAPLAGRTSKRAEKLALVIRPPQQPSMLFLESAEKIRVPLEGFEIWSRRLTDTSDDASEFIGKTDWRGSIEIPANPDGLRLILVKRGSRGLKRLPIIPGLYEEMVTTVPNDETSLFAEGVLLSLEEEILNLVVQRGVYETDISDALEHKDLDLAKTTFNEYQSLETPRDIKTRMADEEVRLKAMTQDNRELEYISKRFDSLRALLNSALLNSRNDELQEKIQKQSSGSPAS